jgi:hypothetical protein
MKKLMENKGRNIVISIILLLLFGFVSYKQSKPQVIAPSVNQEKTAPQIKLISVSQSIYLTREQEGPLQKNQKFAAGTTALEAIEQEFNVVKTGEGKNAFITEINGVKASEKDKTFWALYVNKKQSKLGAGSYILQDKDNIEWKLETY